MWRRFLSSIIICFLLGTSAGSCFAQSDRTALWGRQIMPQPFVHLFSDLNTTAHHALPGDDVPLREEVVPIHDIRVKFGPDYRFRRIHLEPEGRNLEMQKTPEGVSVVVPRLDVHAMVVGELETSAARPK